MVKRDREHDKAESAAPRLGRRSIRVRGTVQGVGFRPMVYRVARAAGLHGLVRDDGEGVWIEIEGDPEALARFPDALRREAPPLSRVETIEIAEIALLGDGEFRLTESATKSTSPAVVPTDAATCAACLRELLDPQCRRFRYPFINCADCGPRYTIVRDVPYDRACTTMDVFAMCALCRAEYQNPGDRRFHAEPNACAMCGPEVELFEHGARAFGDAAMSRATLLLEAGAVVAIKGLGGYQLAVDPKNQDAVARLRARKRRPHKPFALMARGVTCAASIAQIDSAAREALTSTGRPIVLLPRTATGSLAPGVAPGLAEVGIMLPPTPLHHLLFSDRMPLLVMTSGNPSDEPMAKDDSEAMAKLAHIADAFLLHDRPIHSRADDSVVRVVLGESRVVRRARGFVPEPIALGFDAPSVLAVGAELRSTVCITRGNAAYLSPHIGDQENAAGQAFFEESISRLSRLLRADPVAVAHDLNPVYASTRWALRSGLVHFGVQHHHAHIASCLAEHGRTDPVIGVAWDGTGAGPLGDRWGGEFLLADLAGFQRVGHLRPIALAGGEAAIREPWRVGAAALIDAGEPLNPLSRIASDRLAAVRRLVERRVAAPLATGAGRWFDAVAAIAGVRDVVSYDGQAAIELEALAVSEGQVDAYRFDLGLPPGTAFVVDLRNTVRAVAADVRHAVAPSRIAARFHATLAEVIVTGCQRVRRDRGISTVALSGGCFQNRVLTERTKARLDGEGFEVLLHRLVPPNDGGVALGQAAILAFRMRNGRS